MTFKRITPRNLDQERAETALKLTHPNLTVVSTGFQGFRLDPLPDFPELHTERQWCVYVGIVPLPGRIRRQVTTREPIFAESGEIAIEKGRRQVEEKGRYTITHDNTFVQRLGEHKSYPIEYDLHCFLKLRGIEVDCSAKTGFCMGFNNRNASKHYSDWEEEIAIPALLRAGCEILWCWVDGERDSFGPLSRSITVQHQNRFYNMIYG